MGVALSAFMRWRPASWLMTSPAERSTSRCFITPKRLSRGKARTTSVVGRGPERSRSRMARRVGSASAFQTASSLSALATAAGIGLLAGLLHLLQHVVPTLGDALLVLGVEHAERAMTQRDLRAGARLLHFHLDVVDGGIRHEQRARKFEQLVRLDRLDDPPEMVNAVAAVAIPAAPRVGLEVELHRDAVGARVP